MSQPKASKSWILIGLVPPAVFSISNFFISEIALEGVLFTRTLYSPGAMLYLSVFFLVQIFVKKCFRNKPEPSIFRLPRSWKVLLVVIGESLVFQAATLLFMFGFQMSYLSGINQGIFTALFAFQSVWLALFLYFAQGERLTKSNIIGMTLLIACAVLLSLSGVGM